MTDLREWLLRQIDRDERDARKMREAYPTPWEVSDRGWMVHITADEPHYPEVIRLKSWEGQPDGWLGDFVQHVENWNPDRVIADCDARRQIIELADEASGLDSQVDGEFRIGARDTDAEPYVGDLILRQLASRYDDREGYLPEWRILAVKA